MVSSGLPFKTPPGDLHPEPWRRVVGALPGPDEAALAIADLEAAGYPGDEIYALCGADGLRRLDPTGRHHGLWGRLVRGTDVVMASADDIAHNADHIARGGVVVTVPAETRHDAGQAALIIKRHGGTHVRYFGSLTVTDLSS